MQMRKLLQKCYKMIYSLLYVFSNIMDRLLLGMVDSILSSKFQVDKDVSLDTMNSKMRALETRK